MSRGSCGPTTRAATWTERSTTPTAPSDDRRYERLFARLTEYPVTRQSPRPPPLPPTAHPDRTAASIMIQLGEEGRDPRRAFAKTIDAIERIETTTANRGTRFDEFSVATLGRIHAAGVRGKSALDDASRYVGRIPRAPRKFRPFSSVDIDRRVAEASRITGTSLRASVLSSTLMVLS